MEFNGHILLENLIGRIQKVMCGLPRFNLPSFKGSKHVFVLTPFIRFTSDTWVRLSNLFKVWSSSFISRSDEMQNFTSLREHIFQRLFCHFVAAKVRANKLHICIYLLFIIRHILLYYKVLHIIHLQIHQYSFFDIPKYLE